MQAEGGKLCRGNRRHNQTQWSMRYENYLSEYYPVRQVFIFSMLFFSPGPCSLSDCEDYYGRCTMAEDGSGTAQCKCPTADQCSNDARPVCGDNAKTYRNKCFMEAESCAMKYKIEVKLKGPCSEYYATWMKYHA